MIPSPTILITTILTLATGCLAQERRNAPNVLIPLVDDLGWNDMGFHAAKAPTPNINP